MNVTCAACRQELEEEHAVWKRKTGQYYHAMCWNLSHNASFELQQEKEYENVANGALRNQEHETEVENSRSSAAPNTPQGAGTQLSLFAGL